jgi:hypothetical protein
MGVRKRYKKREKQFVVAVQLAFDTEGFTYHKWGGVQQCKRGDWVVSNMGDTYTIDEAVFARTYRHVSPGVYMKITPVWAEVVNAPGSVATREGVSHYESGDYLVYNDEEGRDAYCMNAAKFETMYELDE